MTVLDPNMPTMMGAWRSMISHQFTGMDLREQAVRAEILTGAIPYRANQIFCSLEHEDYLQKRYGKSTEGIYGWCLEQQGMCGSIVFLIAPGPQSLGMEKELVLAKKRKQKVIVCMHMSMEKRDWVKPFLKASDFVLGWTEDEDLDALRHVSDDYF